MQALMTGLKEFLIEDNLIINRVGGLLLDIQRVTSPIALLHKKKYPEQNAPDFILFADKSQQLKGGQIN